MDVNAVLNDDPRTPDTAVRVVSKGQKPTTPFNPHRNDYLNLVLNKPSVPSLRGNASIRSAYGFVISPSAELANGSCFGSPVPHFIESPSVPRSAGLPSSREVSLGSKGTPPGNRRLSRRWSDTSLAAFKAQSELVVPCLPPTFYSPYNYKAPARFRDFTRPSANVSLEVATCTILPVLRHDPSIVHSAIVTSYSASRVFVVRPTSDLTWCLPLLPTDDLSHQFLTLTSHRNSQGLI